MFTGYSALAWVEALKDKPEGEVSIYIHACMHSMASGLGWFAN